jgi:hypothetical protein
VEQPAQPTVTQPGGLLLVQVIIIMAQEDHITVRGCVMAEVRVYMLQTVKGFVPELTLLSPFLLLLNLVTQEIPNHTLFILLTWIVLPAVLLLLV